MVETYTYLRLLSTFCGPDPTAKLRRQTSAGHNSRQFYRSSYAKERMVGWPRTGRSGLILPRSTPRSPSKSEAILGGWQYHGSFCGAIMPGPSNGQIYLHLPDMSSNARISAKRTNTGETSTCFKRAFFATYNRLAQFSLAIHFGWIGRQQVRSLRQLDNLVWN